MKDKIILMKGDCLSRMKEVDTGSVDIIITSPPYADRRSGCYEGMSSTKYVDWFIPIAIELKRVLKPSGSFFLNIKPHTNNGERDLYVFELVVALKREVGFLFVDEFCWTKNGFPGSLKGRFKNAFEPVYHFSISNPSNIKFNPVACGTPMKEESIARSYRKQCGAPSNGSGMTGMNTTNIRNLKLARPSNVINVNNVSNQFSVKKNHPAVFPNKLVDFFIKSFTDEGDTVLDPFMGSGTTGVSSKELGRGFIGIELKDEYFEMASSCINDIEFSVDPQMELEL